MEGERAKGGGREGKGALTDADADRVLADSTLALADSTLVETPPADTDLVDASLSEPTPTETDPITTALAWYAAHAERTLTAIVEPGLDQDDRRRPTAAQPPGHAAEVAATTPSPAPKTPSPGATWSWRTW